MSKLITNTLYYTIGNFTSKAVNFLLLPLYTRYLSPDEFGTVNSMQVLSNVLIIFFTFGLERSIYRLYHDYKTKNEKKDFLGTITIAIIFVSVFVCSILFILDNHVENIYKSITFYPYYAYAILTVLLMTFELVPKISLQVKEKAKEYLGISILLLIFRVLPVIWYVVFQKEGAVGMLKGAMIGNAAALIFLLPITLKEINLRFNLKILFNTLKYCLPLIPTTVSAWVINMSDRIFIERYFSTYEVGIYSLGYNIGQLVQFLSVALLMTYNPFFYKLANSEDQATAKRRLYKVNNASIVFMLCIGFLVAFFAKDIMVLFFNEKYNETYKIIPIITLGYFFIQLISLQNLSFYQAKKTVVIMNINIIAALINISLNFILISRYSYIGAAIATVITQLVFFIITYSLSRRYYFIPYDWRLIFPLLIFFVSLIILNLLFIQVNILSLILKLLVIFIILILLLIQNKKQVFHLLKQTQ